MTHAAISPDYAVSPQIEPGDMKAFREAGFTTIICNRPDMEIPPDLHAARMREAAEAEGLVFVENPVMGGQMTLENVTAQREAIDASAGPVLAYCNSGTRSSVVWAFANAGRMDTDEILSRLEDAGYMLGGLRGQIDALAARGL